MEEQIISMDDKFKFGKKWFWIGILMGLNAASGLIFGVALILEKRHRKEGLIIIIWSIVWLLIQIYIIGPWLTKTGLMPNFQMIKTIKIK